MKRSASFIACASVLLTLAMLAASWALADSITITPGRAGMVTEGKKGGRLTFTVENTGFLPIILSRLDFTPFEQKLGDSADMPTFVSTAGSSCSVGTELGAGDTCTFVLNFTAPADGREKFDFGIYSVQAIVGAGFETSIGTNTIKVTDTPEPSSYLLFGTGLVGMAGVLRRKLRV